MKSSERERDSFKLSGRPLALHALISFGFVFLVSVMTACGSYDTSAGLKPGFQKVVFEKLEFQVPSDWAVKSVGPDDSGCFDNNKTVILGGAASSSGDCRYNPPDQVAELRVRSVAPNENAGSTTSTQIDHLPALKIAESQNAETVEIPSLATEFVFVGDFGGLQSTIMDSVRVSK